MITARVWRDLASSNSCMLKEGSLHKATFSHRVWRLFHHSKALAEDVRIGDIFQRALFALNPEMSETFSIALKVAERFCLKHHGLQFESLKYLLYAQKCHKIGLKISDFYDKRHNLKKGRAKLLEFLMKNKLHNVIPVANHRDISSAILFEKRSSKIYIRAQRGKSFLTKEHIGLILKRVRPEHCDHAALRKMQGLLSQSESPEIPARIADLAGSLKGNYRYIALSEASKKKDLAFLANGLEEHSLRLWKKLIPCAIEEGDGKYHFRLVTKLPDYALEKKWAGFLLKLLPKLINFTKHGHAWLEMVKPIFDEKGSYVHSEIYSDGYYCSPFVNSRKHFLSPDPTTYVPEGLQGKTQREDVEISKEQFKRGKLYAEACQALILRKPFSDKKIEENDLKNIAHLFMTAIYGGTCLTFANELRYLALVAKPEEGDAVPDYRGCLRGCLVPRRRFNLLDGFERIFLGLPGISKVISTIRFVFRAQIPYYVAAEAR